jgi:hypothetical protein
MRPLLPVLLLAFAAPTLAQQATSLPARDRMLPGAPAALYRVGAEEGESWELLSNVSGVDFDGSDNLYVLDAGNHRVLVFDARGGFVRAIGKQGGGPGELQAPAALAVLSDGTIAVADLGRGAFSLFSPQGAFVRNVQFVDSLGIPAPEMPGGVTSLTAHPSGGMAVFGALRLQLSMDGAAPAPPAASVPVYLVPLEGSARVLHRVPREAPVVRSQGGAEKRRMRAAPRAFAPQPAWGVLPDGGVAALRDAGYHVNIVDAQGRTIRVLRRPIEPRRVTRKDQDEARELAAERLRTGTGMVRMQVRAGPGGVERSVSSGGRAPDMSTTEIDEQLRDMQFAEVIPVIAGMRTDPQGRIWVARTARAVGADGPIDLLTADGGYLGTLPPQPLPDAISRSGRAAYVTRDDMDVEQVIVKRLPGWR